ncbi:MAG: DUF362 domain-containing protein [Candidatus Omnitrophota bacterium]|nr:DUF362 domain-containing protein [Candidatus Omnitrophota bacterium]
MSKVYFIKVRESDPVRAVEAKLSRLIDESRLLDFIVKFDKTAVKIHFGDEGNTGHVKAQYAGVLCRKITGRGAAPFLADTNTLYRGRRTISADHIKLAAEHGFTKKACGADIVVPDDVPGEKIASIFLRADSIIGLAHFKGHIMTGFGGALKNVGMGCASREGKLAQHSDIAPIVDLEKCRGCMECVEACPADAIRPEGKRVVIDPGKCIGCAACIASCARGAIEVDWESGGMNIQEKMAEYAGAALANKKGKVGFINFAVKITSECDCLAKDDPRLIPDIGIFASIDPVSIDRACYDACINAAGKDIFAAAHPGRDGFKQLKRAHKLGIGELNYELIEL